MTDDWVNQVKSEMRAIGLTITVSNRLANDTGTQIRTKEGPMVSVFDNGRCVAQGKNLELIKGKVSFLDGPITNTPGRKVFVVYGHDEHAKTELEAMLRRWDVEPLVLDQLPSAGLTIIEKLEKYRGQAAFAVVLATPDDKGHPANNPDQIAFRARQNVVLELGMVLAELGRTKVAILQKDIGHMERPSDIQGLIYIPFKDSVRDAALLLAKEMNEQGLNINLSRV